MLEWLSGVARGDEGHGQATNENYTSIDDAPNTPAPVFAARAFKQLIWGTPNPDEVGYLRAQERRRISRTDQVPIDTAPSLALEEKDDLPVLQTPTKSPAKRPGILLTPGTGGTRRKTVSFERKPYNYQNGLTISIDPITIPKAIPGKFPTPSAPKPEEHRAEPAPSHSQRTRESNTQLKRDVVEDITLDMSAPRSTSGNYWKTEYETFSTRSTMEMRKLAKKEQVAKKYAKSKDSEASKLADMLRNEEKKVIQLQRQVEDYVAQLSLVVKENADAKVNRHDEMRSNARHLSASHQSERAIQEETSGSILMRSSTRQLQSALTNANAQIETLKVDKSKLQAQVARLLSDSEQQQSEIARLKSDEQAVHRTPRSQARRHTRSMTEAQAGFGSDIWADVGNTIEEPVKASRKPQKPGGVSPLRQKSMNIGNVERPQQEKDSGLTLERRAAARKRLEEKRRNREKGAVVV